MNKFESRRRYLLSMFYLSLNNKYQNYSFVMELLADLLIQRLILDRQLDVEEFYGQDKNEYMAFIEGCR